MIYVRLGLRNGEILDSDQYTEAEILDEIDQNDGRIGTSDFANVRVETIDDFVALLSRVFDMALNDLDRGTVSIVVNGQNRDFKSREVAWYRIVR